jgi:hypothetical protein
MYGGHGYLRRRKCGVTPTAEVFGSWPLVTPGKNPVFQITLTEGNARRGNGKPHVAFVSQVSGLVLTGKVLKVVFASSARPTCSMSAAPEKWPRHLVWSNLAARAHVKLRIRSPPSYAKYL